MSTTSLSLTKSRELITNFIKAYKNNLMIDNVQIDDKFINEIEGLSLSKFYDRIESIQTRFGSHYYVFDTAYSGNRNGAIVWLGEHSNTNDLQNKILECSNKNEMIRFWEDTGSWYNLTETRLAALEIIFDHAGTSPVKTATKSTKKTAKKAAPKVPAIVKLSDVVDIKKGVAFIDSENAKFDHAIHFGGHNLDLFVSDAYGLGQKNQIDHVINAFKLAKKEIDEFVNELVKAKEAGATNVVDKDWCTAEDFRF